ncbi:carbamate kinase [Tuanshanicoccus lijuaniae]|uniref:carbamate kinase n=1 Tax=Aerococcaceae bacterium zg-1292 TaxID=2774330 RepID=UPI001938FB8B|nr:carbamate kinase [Aerococcaceae bacterium zg-1292]MBF6625128.1 carbamate kinase [Aerococcaceae bacterium zg-BR9]MBF6978256.1 carbamate kinase [Aerococcaceae bacterium zg-BR22]MBS4456471.1 carbamate kinase [Aerococcaceae bacterium zg-A91]MBS4458321.1 carbamate kinase [Aerococcaceae bacterium zg-BR33]
MAKVVLALGGNALGNTPVEQLEAVKIAAKTIIDLSEEGHNIVVVHGNGPQVGVINLGINTTAKNDPQIPEFPLVECVALSQGYIGYHLQQAIMNEAANRSLDVPTATVVTQVEIDEKDDAFVNPTKPIGNFYTKEEADKAVEEKGHVFVEDSGRGYRRVVPSPKPTAIVELNTVKQLFDNGVIVIAGGGGGVPVVKRGNQYVGVDAVIDKDSVAAKLSSDLKADQLLILTAVEKVSINFNKPNQEEINTMTIEQAYQYIDEKQFAPGSMLPKVESCIAFIKENPSGEAIITSLEKAKDALHGETGTKIVE